jgi:hypothetical protein
MLDVLRGTATGRVLQPRVRRVDVTVPGGLPFYVALDLVLVPSNLV